MYKDCLQYIICKKKLHLGKIMECHLIAGILLYSHILDLEAISFNVHTYTFSYWEKMHTHIRNNLVAPGFYKTSAL